MKHYNKQDIVFLEKTFLQPFTRMRGVEQFNIALLNQLSKITDKIIVPVYYKWKEIIMENTLIPPCNLPVLESEYNLTIKLILLLKQIKSKYVIIGNIADRLSLLLRILKTINFSENFILIAHRMPKRLFLLLLPHNCRVIAVNRFIAQQFILQGFKDVQVYYGIIDADKFYPSKVPPGTRTKFRFCLLGNLDNKWKGAHIAIEGFKRLSKYGHQNIELHLAGFSNPVKFNEKNIYTYPWLNPKFIPNFIRNMDAMLVCSYNENIMRETFSQVMVKGMLTGLPIIANDLEILKEKLVSGGGFIFSNIDELTECMHKLVENRFLCQKLGMEGRNFALKNYVWKTEVFVKKYMSELINKR